MEAPRRESSATSLPATAGFEAEFERLETRNGACPAGPEICSGNNAGLFTDPAGTNQHLIERAEPLL